MKTSPQIHLIFVRPVGSLTWTLHAPMGRIWRDGRANRANTVASEIVEHTNYSAIVVPVTLPSSKEKSQYALFADGDTMFQPVEPFLKSKKTGRAK